MTGNFTGILKRRIKRIDSSYKMIDFLSGRGSSANAVVNVATPRRVQVWSRCIDLKIGVQCNLGKKIGIAGSHFGTHGYTIDLFIIIVRE